MPVVKADNAPQSCGNQNGCTLRVYYGISSPWAYLGARRAYRIADAAKVPLLLKPIRVIEANGGIPLRTRPQARQHYHEIELERWSRYLGIPLNLHPRHYPCRSVELAAQSVIAVMRAGLDAREFSFAVQRALWAEDRDIADLETLREIAACTLGSENSCLLEAQPSPETVSEWQGNLAEAEKLGVFGTPTYVVADELYWGQDRLDFVERALARR